MSVCKKCGKSFELAYNSKRTRVRKGQPLDLCKLCLIRQHPVWDRLTDEQKRKRMNRLRDGHREYFTNLSKKDRDAFAKDRVNSMKKYWSEMDLEERKRLSDEKRVRWNNLPEEVKQWRIQKMREGKERRKHEWENRSSKSDT